MSEVGALRERCQNCGAAPSWSSVGGPGPRAELLRCDVCGGWRFMGRVDEAAERLYDERYFQGGEYLDYELSAASQRRNYERKLLRLERSGCAVGAGTRLLEIGCATGGFLELAREIGVSQAVGVEVSEYARGRALADHFEAYAPDAAELPARLEALAPNLVVAWDVWEHLPEPAATLDEILEKAAPDVTVALTSIDAGSFVARHRGTRWRQYHPPTHLNYPTRRSFDHYFVERGFHVALHEAFGYHRPLLEYVAAVLPWHPRRTGAPWSWPVYLNLYDTQLVVARRTAGA